MQVFDEADTHVNGVLEGDEVLAFKALLRATIFPPIKEINSIPFDLSRRFVFYL